MPASAPTPIAPRPAAPTDRGKSDAPRKENYRWVKETRFGHWFLGTNIWSRYVVDVALHTLADLQPAGARRPARILDAGCGPGVSLPLLEKLFQPVQIIGIEIDPKEIARSRRLAEQQCRCPVEIIRADVSRLPLPDASVDLVLCHQLLHHVVEQEKILAEFFRVLAPGGTLLVAESCREFIHSAPVRLLFRHPNHVQRSASEYAHLIRMAGFEFSDKNIRHSTPFWTLPDWGFRKKIGLKMELPVEPTEVYLAALKPAL